MLKAVKYLHDRNVWHRDLKSANIMISQESGTRIIKVGSTNIGSRVSVVEGSLRIRVSAMNGFLLLGLSVIDEFLRVRFLWLMSFCV